MGGGNLVIPKRTDQKQVFSVAIGDDMLQQFEAGCIGPLQVVKKKYQGVLRAGKYSDEVAKHSIETVGRLRQRQFRNRLLRTDDDFNLRDDVNNELTIKAKRTVELLFP